MKYKIGDRLEDNKEGGIIEIIEVTPKTNDTNGGYEITIDGVYWDYGATEHYLDKNCTKVN